MTTIAFIGFLVDSRKISNIELMKDLNKNPIILFAGHVSEQ